MTEYSKFWTDLKSGRFASMVKESTKGRILSGPQEVYNILKPLMMKEDDVEKMYVIFLDAQNKVLGIKKLFSGSIASAYIHPREVIKHLIRLKSPAFIMAHNHPSGDTNPTNEDKKMTKKVMIAAKSIDATLHDHIIIGNGYHSMADSGWIHSAKIEILKYLETLSYIQEDTL